MDVTARAESAPGRPAVGTDPRTGLGLTRAELDAWPGRERREPARSDPHYLILAVLAEQMRSELERRLAGRSDVRVLDVGCGAKPYLPLVAPYASEYRGVDAVAGPHVDDVGSAERLPYPDGSFDLLLCTQVLEHVDNPAEAVREMFRVLRPGGVALVSTHGVFLYHPDPPDSGRDFWRWTHAGLLKLFGESARWREVEVSSQREVFGCLAYIACQFVEAAGRRYLPDFLRAGAVAALNSAAAFLDARFPPNARVPRPGSLSANYLVVATKEG